MQTTKKQKHKLKEFKELFWGWNKTYSLISKGQTQNLKEHIEDSISVISHLGESVLDLGSGGGLPGIPLAICAPDKRIFLIESNSKKAAFLLHSTNALKLKNTRIVNARAEELKPSDFPEGYEILTRAFGTFKKTIIASRALLEPPNTSLRMMKTAPLVMTDQLPEGFKISNSREIKSKEKDKKHILVTIVKKTNE